MTLCVRNTEVHSRIKFRIYNTQIEWQNYKVCLFTTVSDCCGLRDTVTLNEMKLQTVWQNRLLFITDFTGPEPVLGLSVTSVRNTVRQRSVQEQIKRWNSIQSCRQARQILQDSSTQFAKYAVRLSRKDLKILVGLWHITLNQHLTLLKIKEDPMCPLCEEEYDISLHLLRRCCALVGKRRKQSGKHLLVPSELKHEHWSSLLKFVKNSKRFQ